MASSQSAPSTAPSLVDTLFQLSLDDLVKSLRADQSAVGESSAVGRALSAIHREIRAPDAATKAIALQKLTYLSSLHFAPVASHPLAFPAIELLASPHLPHKRLAYLAASLSLHPASLSLLPLATHQLHKDLSPSTAAAASHHVCALALQLLASPAAAAAPDLAVHLAHDLVPHLSRGSPRAIVAAARVIAASPSAGVPVLFKPLAACLASPDPRASTAAASAFCELSAPPADAAPFLSLAPDLYNLLTTSRSNWALIKVLKIFARLAPLESRLAARIADPVCQLLARSSAMSLTFECVRTVLTALPAHDAAVSLAIGKVKEFLTASDDPNLRYLGLLALGMLGPAYASTVNESRDVIALSLGDTDSNIRGEALHLMMGMLDDNNVMDIAGMLVSHAARSDPEFANDTLGAVLAACGRNVYELVSDFDWYVSLLADMARSLHCPQGDEIGRQLVDVGLRVRDARPELVQSARSLLIDPALLGNNLLFPVLSAAAFISGEYIDCSKDPVELVEALLQPRTSLLPMSVRAVYIQAVLKVITFCCNLYVVRLNDLNKDLDLVSDELAVYQTGSRVSEAEIRPSEEQVVMPGTTEKDPFSHKSILYMINLIEITVGPLVQCKEVEVLERARNLMGFVHLLREIQELKERKVIDHNNHNRVKELIKSMQTVFSQELSPVYVNAQKKISLPEDLILNENLAELADIVSEDDTTPSTSIFFCSHSNPSVETRDEPAVSVDSSSLLFEHRRRHGMYYLPTGEVEGDADNYPRANDPLLPADNGSMMKGKSETVQPVSSGKKLKATRSRPKVVKLDGEDFLSAMMTSVNVPKENSLSSAVGSVLMGRDEKSLSSVRASDKSSERMGNKMDTGETSSQWTQNIYADVGSHPTSSSRTSKHRAASSSLPHLCFSFRPIEPDRSSSREERSGGAEMEAVKSLLKPKPTPQQQLREWQRRLRNEGRNIERQIRDVEREQKKVEKAIREAAKRDDIGSAKALAKEVVRSRKAVNRLYENKAQLNSISMHLGEIVATTRTVGHLSKSTEVMKLVNDLMKAPEVAVTMQEFSKEMTKAGVMEEMVNDAVDSALDNEDMEEEIEEEVDKVLSAIAGETASQLPDAVRKQKEKVTQPSTSEPVERTAIAESVDDDDEDELEKIRERLAKVRS